LVLFTKYIFKLEISRLFVLSVFPLGLLALFIVRRILRRRLLRARNQGRYLSRVLLLHSGISDPVERRLALAQHAGFSVVHKIVTAENFKLDVKEIVSNALNNNCDQIMVGQSAVISAAELRKLGWALEQTTIDLIVAPAVTEIAGPRLKVSNVEGLPLLHLEQPTFSGASRVTKRILDFGEARNPWASLPNNTSINFSLTKKEIMKSVIPIINTIQNADFAMYKDIEVNKSES
jgi:hypothetical protein